MREDTKCCSKCLPYWLDRETTNTRNVPLASLVLLVCITEDQLQIFVQRPCIVSVMCLGLPSHFQSECLE